MAHRLCLVLLVAAARGARAWSMQQETAARGASALEQLARQLKEQVVVGTQGEQAEEGEELAPTRAARPPLCGIGDLHGDPSHALEALRLCGAVDADGHWSGGTMTVVQVGDVLDRGNASLPLQELLWSLRDQAAEAGGELKLLIGNHELLNMQGKVFYVHGYDRRGDAHAGELAEYGGAEAWRQAMHPRDGAYGARIVQHDALALRGEGACRTLFLHAGLRSHAAAKYGSIDALNTELREQIRSREGELLDPQDGPLWFRGYARPDKLGGEEAACAELHAALTAVGDGAARMAVGHNIVPWVTTRCGGALQMLDVGMSGAYGGRPAAWTCALDAEGAAVVRAIYREGEEPPPPLCERCVEAVKLHRSRGGGLLSADDLHDCHTYCGVSLSMR